MGLVCGYIAWREWKAQQRQQRESNQNENTMISILQSQKIIESFRTFYLAIFGLVATAFGFRATYLANGNIEDLIALENSRLESSMIQWKPPSYSVIRTITAPFHAFLNPIFIDMQKIPVDRPLLFVSNHTIMGLDYPLLLVKLWRDHNIFIRALADHSHFQVPLNATIMREIMGAVDGTRRNVDLLMQNGSAIFVYPGGARETFKKTTDKKYELIWGQRKGFAQMAIRHGCTIVPVTNYGTEDMVEVVRDIPLGWVPIPFLWRSNRTLPLMIPTSDAAKGRVYFLIGDPIHTDAIKGQEEDEEVLDEIVQKTKTAIENGIEILRQRSEQDNEASQSSEGTERFQALGRWLRLKAAKERGDVPIDPATTPASAQTASL